MATLRKWINHKLLGLCLCLSACVAEGTWFHHYEFTGKEGWERTDTLAFPLPPLSADSSFDAYVGLRVEPSFPYRNLWLAFQLQNDSIGLVYADTLCCELCDSAGNLKGNGVTTLQYEQFLSRILVPGGGKNEIRIFHVMKKEVVPQVKEIGVRLNRHP